MKNSLWRIPILMPKLAPVVFAAVMITMAVDGGLIHRAISSEQPAYQLSKENKDRRVGPPILMSSGGPDSYGYRWIDSDETSGPKYDWTDISSIGTPVVLLDDSSVSVSLPFNFVFYGVQQSVVRICSNGYLTFGFDGDEWQNDSIPDASAPNDVIAPFWDDLNPEEGGTIHYYHNTGENEFIVQYTSVAHFSGGGETGEYTFQVILRPNGSILFQYSEMLGELASATIGIENPSGTTGLEIVFNSAYVKDDLAVKIWPVYNVPSNYSTIQAAIATAIGLGDTVLVAPGTYTGAGNKNLDFDGKNIVLMSEVGAESTIIDCEAVGRGIHFHSGEDSTSVVDGFTITGGNASYAGGIRIAEYSSPTIKNCIITGNYASNQAGGIEIRDFSVASITNCTITDNSAQNAAGIQISHNSSPTITNCIIAGNSAQFNAGFGISFSSSPTITNCLITGNLSINFAGGIVLTDTSSAEITNCTITGNRAANNRGGGIYVISASTLYLVRSIVWGNCASSSGDQIWMAASANGAYITCCDVDSFGIEGDSKVDYVAGNVFTDPRFCSPVSCFSAPTTLGDYTLAMNSPSLPIGNPCGELMGALGAGCTGPSDFLVPGNYPTIQSAINAAGSGDTVLVSNGTYTGFGNKDLDFDGKNIVLMSENGADFTTIDCEGSGRGIFFHNGEDSTSVVDGFTILNGGVATDGGGIHISGSSYPTIVNCVIQNCTATVMGANGGGIYVESPPIGTPAPEFRGCTIAYNSADSAYGGGMYIRYASVSLDSCTITGNFSGGGGGGGILINNADPTFSDCTIIENSTGIGGSGGGIYLFLGEPTFLNCTISGNTCAQLGGGMLLDESDAIFTNCIVTGNTGWKGGGGFALLATPVFTGCSFTGNRVTLDGGGLYFSNATSVTVTRTIVWGNCADGSGDEAYVLGGDVSFACSDVDSSGVAGSGIINYDPNTIFTDPLFCNAAPCFAAPTPGGDYTLHTNSACLADSSPCNQLIGALDQGCESRVFGVGGEGDFYPTIQSAIDATSEPGDSVLVADNTWTGDGNTVLDFDGREIVLVSENGPATTIIDGEWGAQGLVFQTGESRNAVVDGFSIVHGDSTVPGSAIFVTASSPTIRNCIITTNKSDSGVVRIESGDPLFESCTIQEDTSTASDGVLTVISGSADFDSCTIQNNVAAVQCVLLSGGSPSFTECVIQNNTAGNAVLISTPSMFSNSFIVGNSGIGMYFTPGAPSTVDNCQISGNTGWGIVLEANSSMFTAGYIQQNMGGGVLITGVTTLARPDSSGAAAAPLSNNPVFTGYNFSGNVNTTSDGGGTKLDCGNTPLTLFQPQYINCTFSGNSSSFNGGGIAVCGNAVFADITPLFSNCTISANTAGGEGGGIYMGVNAQGAGAEAILDHTILWGNCTTESNSGQAYVETDNEITFMCSNITSYGISGPGAINFANGVTYGHPLFCQTIVCDTMGTIAGNFTLAATSAASPDSSPCGELIGANPVTSCTPTETPHVPVLPVETVLWPCAPNPFNPATVIQYDLAKRSHVTLRIFDVAGRLVRTLVDRPMPRARHRMVWDGVDNHGNRVSTGVYFLRLSTRDVVRTGKMVLIK